MNSNFIYLLQAYMPQVEYIYWDLDGTLGDFPGWNGVMPIHQYLHDVNNLKALLAELKRRDIKNWLVSRNSMFCAPYHSQVEESFQEIGFDRITTCYRQYLSESKVAAGSEPVAGRRRILLVDDQEVECMDAMHDGSYALHVPAGLRDSLRLGNYALLIPPPLK